jgi:hypothetical protein
MKIKFQNDVQQNLLVELSCITRGIISQGKLWDIMPVIFPDEGQQHPEDF